jgi:dTDP-4-dehydrorhamnose reductase
LIIENDLIGMFHSGTEDMITQGKFYEKIISKLTSNKDVLQYRLYEDKNGIFYFRLHSNCDEIPSSLKSTNQDIISYLLG